MQSISKMLLLMQLFYNHPLVTLQEQSRTCSGSEETVNYTHNLKSYIHMVPFPCGPSLHILTNQYISDACNWELGIYWKYKQPTCVNITNLHVQYMYIQTSLTSSSFCGNFGAACRQGSGAWTKAREEENNLCRDKEVTPLSRHFIIKHTSHGSLAYDVRGTCIYSDYIAALLSSLIGPNTDYMYI